MISEVYADGTFQLTNTGTETVDVSSYWICSFPTYESLSSLEISCGSAAIAPASSTTFSGFAYSDSNIGGSELALYNANTFSDVNAILSYVEWGAWGHTRSSLAVEADLWQNERFAPDFQSTESLVLADDQWTINSNPVVCPREDSSMDDDLPMTTETYTITINTTWSEESHPTDFPFDPHFSGIIGMTHTSDTTLFDIGATASTGIKNMAETGAKIFLIQEIQRMVMQGNGGSLISGNGISLSPGSVSLELVVSSTHPLMSFTSMVAPSPDWFIGVKDFELYNNGKWVDRMTIPLNIYDAGTDSGVSYASPNLATEPLGVIEMITSGPLATNGVVPSLGSVTIERMNICDLSPRSISTTHTTIFCVGEGIDDLIDVEVNLLQDDASYLESTWVLTNPLGVITDLPEGPPFNFENTGPGVGRIWNLNHTEDLQGLVIGNSVEELEGCFTFSNSIEIFRLDSDACAPIDTMETNPIDTMETCDLSPRSISTTHTTIFCVGEGIDDLIDVEVNLLQDDASYLESTWVLTNPLGVITDLPEGPPFNFENTGPGVGRIWNLNHTEDLQGLVIGNSVEELEGCFTFSNSIEIFRLDSDACAPIDTMETNPVDTMETNPIDTMETNPVDTMETCDLSPRSISTRDTTIFCIGDDIDDLINVEVNLLQDDASYLESAWIITNAIGTIIDLPEGPPFNFENAEPGICRIWNLNYAAGIQGLVIDNPVEELEGCFSFSNPIEVIRLPNDACMPVDTMETSDPVDDIGDDSNPVDTTDTCDLLPRLIATDDPTIFCVGEGIDDLINIDVTLVPGGTYLESAWVITNTAGIIVELPEGPPFNFEDAGVGIGRIWNLNYVKDIQGLNINNSIEDLEGCFTFSNSIEVFRLDDETCAPPPIDTCNLLPRIISTPDTTIFCVGEGIDNLVNVNVSTLQNDSAAYQKSAWVITNTAGIILDLPEGPPFSFEDAGPGICQIWDLNYKEGIQGLAIDNNIERLEGCFNFSNPVEVFRLNSDACPAAPIDTMDNSNPIDTMETNPVDTMETNPVDTVETNPVDTVETNPVDTMETNPVDTMETNPVDTMETNPVDTMETNPVDTMETNPVDTMETNPVDTMETNPVDTMETNPVDTMETNPVDTMETNPVDTMETNPVDTMETNPVDTMETNPVDTMETNPVDTMETNPVDTMETNPVDTMETNPVDTICDISGGIIEGGPFKFCLEDTTVNTIPVGNILLNDNTGSNSQWVITDSAGIKILGLPNLPSDVDFTSTGIGVCQLWHLSYEDSLVGAVVDGNVADLQGCFSLSNPITVTRRICSEENNVDNNEEEEEEEEENDSEEEVNDSEEESDSEEMSEEENDSEEEGNQNTCTAPTDPTVNLDGSNKAVINWTAVEGATTYIIQIRFKGQNRWAARATLRKPTVRIFAPAGKDYEYHIKSICDGGESEYGEVFEFNTPQSGIISSESRSSKDNFQADIVLTLPNKQLILTPNPVSNQLQIDYPITTENTSISIYSINGQKVYEQSLEFGTFGQTINVGHLDNGFYILRIIEDGATAVSHKLIKQ